MENNFIISDDLLWDYADGFLGKEEIRRVDAYLRQYPEQKARLDAILDEKRAFSALNLEKPDAGFSQQLMAAWAAEQGPAKTIASEKTKGRDWILWAIALSFGAILAVPFLMAPAAGVGSVQIPQEYIPQLDIPKYDWTEMFDSALLRNALLLALALTSLKLLDKYLQVRRLQLVA